MVPALRFSAPALVVSVASCVTGGRIYLAYLGVVLRRSGVTTRALCRILPWGSHAYPDEVSGRKKTGFGAKRDSGNCCGDGGVPVIRSGIGLELSLAKDRYPKTGRLWYFLKSVIATQGRLAISTAHEDEDGCIG
jgi:hypothetical protein